MKRFYILVISLFTATLALADNTKYVNVFMGTAGDHGQVSPGACVPLGAVTVCPDCIPPRHAGYDYEIPAVSGISVNRISGTGGNGVGGNLSVRPALPSASLNIVKGTEEARPGYYECAFDNGSTARLTATRDMAVEQYWLDDEQVLFVDFLSSIEPRRVSCAYWMYDSNTIKGWVKAPSLVCRGSYKLYFTLKTDKPFTLKESSDTKALLKFKENWVQVRIAVSAVDNKSADEIIASNQKRSFGDIRNEAHKLWQEKLDRVSVSGADREAKELFYTSLYLLYHSPLYATSPDGRFYGTDGNLHCTLPEHTYYSGWSIWDTFRTKFPMLTVLDPAASRDISYSLSNLYLCGKKNWATPHESGPTVRTEHALVVMLDNYRKGLATHGDLSRGYPGMVKEAEKDYLLKQPDQRLESAYDYWALAQIAEIVGKPEDAAKYAEMGEKLFLDTWRKDFMNIDSSYSLMKGNGLYQGTRWQYRWMCAEYLDKVIELKGEDVLRAELEEFFAKLLFNQGNEPDIQTPFLFNRFGAPDKTCEIVRNYLTDEKMVHIYGGNAEYPEPFVGRAFRNAVDGYAPEMDEDDGTMSAWYMFCQMGFYPLCPGVADYDLFSPQFDKVVIKLDGGKKAEIRTRGRKSYGDVIRGIKLDGKPLAERRITHDFFVKGGVLEFEY